MKRISIPLLLIIIASIFSAKGQSVQKVLTLEEVINIAKKQSPDGLVATNKFKSSYWQYRTFKAGFMPMLSFNATLPSINRSISKVTNQDGSQSFVDQKSADYSLKMNLTKTIGLTGGQVFINSGFERYDEYKNGHTTSFLTNPVTIGYSQPVFAYNPYRWSRKIQPLLYDEAKQQYLEDVEQLSMKATNLFFDLLDAQIRARIAKINQANNDTLYKIARGRYNLGKIAENELLQLELSLLNSNLQLEQTRNEVEVALFKLKSFLGIKSNEKIELEIPHQLMDIKISAEKAIAEARGNRTDAIMFERKLIEARSNVNRAKTENRFNANIYALYGLTQSADQYNMAYKNPLDQQQLALGLQVPILDWGLAKAKIKVAESNQELVNTQIAQQRIDFDQEIMIKVLQFNMQYSQLLIAAKADTIGEKRFMVTKERYMIGKLGITDLNIAMTEKDRASQDYLSALRSFWFNYFDMRRLTLYDFMQDTKLGVDFETMK